MPKKNPVSLSFDTIRLEGSLFLPDILEKAARGELVESQSPDQYQIPKGLTLQDEYGRAFLIAQAQWKSFAATLDRQDLDVVESTQQFVQEFLRDALGLRELEPIGMLELAERRFPISLMARRHVPVVVAPHTLELDDPDPRFAIVGGGARKKSAFQLAQEFLNASPECTWGLVSNGRQLRLLRDAATLTRPSFLEFDLQAILQDARYSDFAACWRLLHGSRAGATGAPGTECIWEQWRLEGQREGTRIREGLGQGVKAALVALGEGFLQHPANEALRRDLQSGALPVNDPAGNGYFQQLLHFVYRCIFLFTVEERGLLHTPGSSPERLAARRIYAEGYALSRLRERCLRRAGYDHHDDLWQGLRVVIKGLARGEPRLALPALGGLFDPRQCPNLDRASLSNRALLTVMRHLRWSDRLGTLAPVDYRNMGPEELGSVYETLLEMVPEVDVPARRFSFFDPGEDAAKGNARKKSGSYYTPDNLVQALIKTALDPVIDARIAANPADPTGALLAIRVVDPACGSGHFLLAAARRLAERLAALRAPEGAVRPQDWRHALREVIARCIYGVDRNPMALELARTALWLEGFEEGRPLSFLDHHLVCGDALIGLTDLKQLAHGIPDAAFKPLSGDDKAVCKAIAKENKEGLKAFARLKHSPQFTLALESASALGELEALETMPGETPAEIAAKEAAYSAFLQHARESRLARAADLFVGAFLATKRDAHALAVTPTSRNLYLELFTGQSPDELPEARQSARLEVARRSSETARVLHWPLAFAQIFAKGGFDCVLGNPPWERIKLQEEEFFASKNRHVAEARNKAERHQRIEWLAEGMLARHLYPELEHHPDEVAKEKETYEEFIAARRTAEAASVFAHLKADEGGRYPLTGVGDVNTYALFAETISQITHASGRAGFIVPTGIATDDSTKAFFGEITQKGRLVSLYDIENREAVFPSVHRSYKFCLLTLGAARSAEFVFFATQVSQLADPRRRFTLTPDEFRLINPNTLTCPVFRSERDAELTKKIYRAAPVLIEEGKADGNPWGIIFMRQLDMANDSHLFLDQPVADSLPLYEAKMVHQFDHRWATYTPDGNSREVTDAEKADPDYRVTPRYWVAADEVEERLTRRDRDGNVIWRWTRGWLMGWRDITNATNERTVIASVVGRVGVGNNLPLMLFAERDNPQEYALLLGNLCALVFDFVARHKTGGTHMNYFIYKQLPVLPPERYTEADLAFIVPRVLELTYTAHDLKPWAEDLGYSGEPFAFDPARRALLRAELDAYYAKLYGLTRDELRYILDPADVMGEDYPSETFRVLKKNEEREFGEYRTQRLVLEAWDRQARTENKLECIL